MGSSGKRGTWEAFVRRPGDLQQEGIEIPLVVRDLSPGSKKYRMRHVVATLTRNAGGAAEMDTLYVRTAVGVRLPEAWGIKILRDLPIEVPGKPYQDFFAALRRAANQK